MHLQLHLVSLNAFKDKKKAKTYRDRAIMLRLDWERRGHSVRARSKRRNHSKRRNRKRAKEMRGCLSEKL